MVQEVLAGLGIGPGSVCVDGTVGLGGHACALLEASAPNGRVIAVDRDTEALGRAAQVLAPFGPRVTLAEAVFAEIPQVLKRVGIDQVNAILLDLGVSSLQLERAERGFSFQRPGPLDMRMDARAGRTAADVVRDATEPELERVFRELGEERWARRIARAIVAARRVEPITTTDQLAEVIWRAVPPPARYGRIHPATRVFQSLRMEVNGELELLHEALRVLPGLLLPGGRLCIISFHSLEDRSVKHAFRHWADDPGFRVLTRRPLTAGSDEVEQNPRSRSAKLRVLERAA